MQSIELEPSGGNAPNSAWTAARAALWLRDPDRALAARSAMDGLRGRWVENARRVVDAGIAALEGRIEESVTTYLRAWETWEAMNLPLARATSTVDAAMLLPLQNVPSEAVAWARGYLKELGAAPLLERLETAQADAAQAAR